MNSVTCVRNAHDCAMDKVSDFLLVCSRWEKRIAHCIMDEFTLDHMAAALWLKERHGMALEIKNFYSLVRFWSDALLAPPSERRALPPDHKFAPTEFNPRHLLAYFEEETLVLA